MATGHFSGVDGRRRPAGRTAQGVPVHGYAPTAGLPPVAVARWGAEPDGEIVPVQGAHAHDFLLLLYVESGRHRLRVDGQDWGLDAGDAFVIAPGAVVGPRPDVATAGRHPDDAAVWAVLFPVDAVDPGAASSLVSWRAHPLLSPFVGSGRSGGHRLRVPPEDRATWSRDIADLRSELQDRCDGYAEAVRAHLTLLLVRLGRLGLDVPFELDADPLLAAVFDIIETRYHEPISLDDVAAAVSQSAGHLTTVVGRRTGRTVGQWITERRMREARRLLADTDLTIGEIATRVGYRDPGYFTRRFRASHQLTPRAWRRSGR